MANTFFKRGQRYFLKDSLDPELWETYGMWPGYSYEYTGIYTDADQRTELEFKHEPNGQSKVIFAASALPALIPHFIAVENPEHEDALDLQFLAQREAVEKDIRENWKEISVANIQAPTGIWLGWISAEDSGSLYFCTQSCREGDPDAQTLADFDVGLTYRFVGTNQRSEHITYYDRHDLCETDRRLVDILYCDRACSTAKVACTLDDGQKKPNWEFLLRVESEAHLRELKKKYAKQRHQTLKTFNNKPNESFFTAGKSYRYHTEVAAPFAAKNMEPGQSYVFQTAHTDLFNGVVNFLFDSKDPRFLCLIECPRRSSPNWADFFKLDP